MKFEELDIIWQKIFEMEWESVCHQSKAIAAVIVDDGWFENKTPDQYSIECIFNELSRLCIAD